MREPINAGITSSSFRQLSPEIIIVTSWLRLPVLVCVNVAARVDKGAICIAVGEVRWQRTTTGEVCNEAETQSWSRGRMEWPRGRTFTASSIWSPLLHPHQRNSICWWCVQEVAGHLRAPTLHWFALAATVGLSARGNHIFGLSSHLKSPNLECSFLHGQDTWRVRVRGVI